MTQIVPPVTEPVTVNPEKTLTVAELAGFAREIAIGLRPEAVVLRQYSLTTSDYEKLKAHPLFTKLLEVARMEWQGAHNTVTRTQIEAALAAEEALPYIYARVVSGKEPLNHTVEAVKWMTDIAGLKKDNARGSGGEQFKIVINFGGTAGVNYEGNKLVDVTPEPAALPAPDEERV